MSVIFTLQASKLRAAATAALSWKFIAVAMKALLDSVMEAQKLPGV